MKLQKPNRDKVTKPKSGRGWCNTCDAEIIHKGEKCPRCGVRDISKRRKK